MNIPSQESQHGFSLVELMVALTISLILLAGILQILLGNKQSFKVQQATAELQENARLASFILDNVVAHAGYKVQLRIPENLIFHGKTATDLAKPLPPKISNGAFVSGTSGGNDGNDTLRIRFQASGGLNNCLGNQVGSSGNPKTADIGFDVKISGTTQTPTLYCRNLTGSDTAREPLVDNVDRFKVRYGLDTNNDNAVDTYVDNYPDPAHPGKVLSLHIQLLLQSDPAVAVSPQDNIRNYVFADSSVFSTDEDAKNLYSKRYPNNANRNRVAYQMVDQTIALRNALP